MQEESYRMIYEILYFLHIDVTIGLATQYRFYAICFTRFDFIFPGLPFIRLTGMSRSVFPYIDTPSLFGSSLYSPYRLSRPPARIYSDLLHCMIHSISRRRQTHVEPLYIVSGIIQRLLKVIPRDVPPD